MTGCNFVTKSFSDTELKGEVGQRLGHDLTDVERAAIDAFTAANDLHDPYGPADVLAVMDALDPQNGWSDPGLPVSIFRLRRVLGITTDVAPHVREGLVQALWNVAYQLEHARRELPYTAARLDQNDLQELGTHFAMIQAAELLSLAHGIPWADAYWLLVEIPLAGGPGASLAADFRSFARSARRGADSSELMHKDSLRLRGRDPDPPSSEGTRRTRKSRAKKRQHQLLERYFATHPPADEADQRPAP